MQYFHDVSRFGIIRDILVWEKDQFPVCREMTKVRKEAFDRAAVLGKGSGLRQALHLKEYFQPLQWSTLEEQCWGRAHVSTPYTSATCQISWGSFELFKCHRAVLCGMLGRGCSCNDFGYLQLFSLLVVLALPVAGTSLWPQQWTGLGDPHKNTYMVSTHMGCAPFNVVFVPYSFWYFSKNLLWRKMLLVSQLHTAVGLTKQRLFTQTRWWWPWKFRLVEVKLYVLLFMTVPAGDSTLHCCHLHLE